MTEHDEAAIAGAAEAMLAERHIPPTSSADDRIAERHVNGRRHRASPGPPSPGLPADLVLQGPRPEVMWVTFSPVEARGYRCVRGVAKMVVAVVADLGAAPSRWAVYLAQPKGRMKRLGDRRHSTLEGAQRFAERYIHRLITPPR